MGRATEKDWPKRPSDRQLQRGSKKDSDRAITPVAEAVRVPTGQAAASPSHWGRAATGKKKSCVYVRRVALVVSDSLRPCGLWPARLSVREGGSPGKNTGAYWPIQVAIPFRALYFLLP